MRLVWNVALTARSDGRLADPESLWDAVRRYADAVTRDDVEVEVRFMPRTAEAMKYPTIALLNGALLIEDIRRSVADGAHGVMIAPVGEPALDEARSAVDVPVVGSLEAAMALTQFLGREVGVITISEAYVTTVRRNLSRYGLAGRLMGHRPIRHIAMDWRAVAAALDGDPDPLLDSFTAVADAMIADGADVLVAAARSSARC
jgi:allantoin racemase